MNDNLDYPGIMPSAKQQTATMVWQKKWAKNTWLMRLRCPELAKQIAPGQFFMIRDPETNDPLLGRPFALLDTYEESGQTTGIDFGYVVVGKLTEIMAEWEAPQRVEIWGPLGNGFPTPPSGTLTIVAGGIGQTPFFAVARETLGIFRYGDGSRKTETKSENVTICYGSRSKDYLAGVEEFRAIPGLELHLATDDGSEGYHGFVTDLFSELCERDGNPDAVYTCGPEPMMHIVGKMCLKKNIPCWLSLETPMACGIGACFSCVTRIKMSDGGWDYRRTCVEGPVFSAEMLVF